ncbi:hypothetical protein AB4565_04190, partial [Vibrio breoganii]
KIPAQGWNDEYHKVCLSYSLRFWIKSRMTARWRKALRSDNPSYWRTPVSWVAHTQPRTT